MNNKEKNQFLILLILLLQLMRNLDFKSKVINDI